MTDLSQHWFEFGNKDLKDAKILFRGKSYQGCILHCHQAIEKHLKGYLSANDIDLRRTHDLPSLLNDTKLDLPDDILEFAEELNAYYQPSRYPDTALSHSITYGRKTADHILKMSETTIKWLHFHNKHSK